MFTGVELLPFQGAAPATVYSSLIKEKTKTKAINQIKQTFPELLGQEEAQAPFISKTSPGYCLSYMDWVFIAF